MFLLEIINISKLVNNNDKRHIETEHPPRSPRVGQNQTIQSLDP